jgi:hypothetical protein
MKLFSAHTEDLRTLYICDLEKTLDMEQKISMRRQMRIQELAGSVAQACRRLKPQN